MTHPLVTQLRFARSEFRRGLGDVSDADGRRRLGPMNCIAWVVAHLANQERRYWVVWAQGKDLHPELHELAGYGKPASTPAISEMWAAWQAVTAAADAYLDTLTDADLDRRLMRDDGKPAADTIGGLLLRNIYHYWFHLGEGHAIRQSLGHAGLPEFVGDMAGVTYRLAQ